MAWNEPGNSNNKDPWGNGNRKGGNDQGPPDLDEIYRDTVTKFKKAFGGKGGNSSTPSNGNDGGMAGLGILALVAVLIWVWMGISTIKEAERGVVLRFGQFHTILEPGLKWQPAFIDRVIPIDVESVVSMTSSGQMLTQDENVVVVSMDIQYRVLDARAYLFNVTDPDYSLRQATDAALRYVIGHTNMDEILTTGREVVRQQTRELLENTIEPYDLGLEVVDVNFLPARPPEEVKEAFDDAIAAQEDEEKFINEANAYAREREPAARGRVRRIEQEANAYKDSVILKAQGEIARFEQLLPQYIAAPEVTRNRLYLETMEKVYQNTSKVMIDVDGGNNMMYLPLDKILEQSRNAQQSQSAAPVRSSGPQPVYSNPTSSTSNRSDRFSDSRYSNGR
ncbi:FtsH protease activity modulator HflK [Catenovulum sp. SM1970]|uniref:FtsH protease activity modulator HflK n=1 Tax=Marinifaba aquimaris TaxID=2741323 RepID=UPI0015721CBC|nr:FtsH protease activity modulator HflK [Marinifaba aquimaris]NTS77475.1 FtsH protease activity modulator HflK [Marinifaba aquimaris]